MIGIHWFDIVLIAIYLGILVGVIMLALFVIRRFRGNSGNVRQARR